MENTHQSIFDTVVANLRKQKRRAFDSGKDQCLYLTANGEKCAVGGIMSDKAIDTYGKLDGDLKELRYIMLSDFWENDPIITDESNSRLLSDLQVAHDTLANWDHSGFIGEFGLSDIAHDHELTYTPPAE